MRSQNKKTYAVFDFDNFNDKGLNKFAGQLKQRGVPVDSITATNRVTRKDGIKTKKAVFFHENLQRSEVVISDHGDIVTLKINGKPQPTGEPKTLSKFAKHIATLLGKSQAAFDKALEKKEAKIKIDPEAGNKKAGSRSTAARTAAVKSELEKAIEINLALKSKKSGLVTELQTVSDSIVKTGIEVQSKRGTNRDLRDQLAALQKESK